MYNSYTGNKKQKLNKLNTQLSIIGFGYLFVPLTLGVSPEINQLRKVNPTEISQCNVQNI